MSERVREGNKRMRNEEKDEAGPTSSSSVAVVFFFFKPLTSGLEGL